MTNVLLTVMLTAVVAAAAFGAAVFILGRTEGLRFVEPDGVPRGLPDDRPLRAGNAPNTGDIANLRFDMALRGYRMAQVDAVLRRLDGELTDRQARISALEQQIVELKQASEKTPRQAAR